MWATFRKFGLEITIEANKKTVQFLDVEFNLEKYTYKPFIKPGDIPLYVNAKSNHPPSVLKNIPEGVNRRLSNLSSDENMFNTSLAAPGALAHRLECRTACNTSPPA